MNSWSFSGNLGGDCETRFTQGGDPIVSFSVGVKSGFGDKAQTVWARCSMFGKRAESVAPYLIKGQLVGVVGEFAPREWTDKQGQVKTSMDVRVNDLTLLGRRADVQPPQDAPAPRSKPAAPPAYDFADDVPF